MIWKHTVRNKSKKDYVGLQDSFRNLGQLRVRQF